MLFMLSFFSGILLHICWAMGYAAGITVSVWKLAERMIARTDKE